MMMIKYEPGGEMMCITKDGDFIMEGNYWDFPQDPKGYAALFKRLGAKKVTVKLYDGENQHDT